MNTRRGFLVGLAITGAVGEACLGALGISAGQSPETIPPQKPGQEKNNPTDAPSDSPKSPSAEKRMLEDNEKDIKKKVEKLYELATELKAEVDKTDSSKVLSVTLLKKTEEIEKLARDIRNRSKG